MIIDIIIIVIIVIIAIIVIPVNSTNFKGIEECWFVLDNFLIS